MIQDLEEKRLENEYRNILPASGDRVFYFKESDVLIKRDEDGFLHLPEKDIFSKEDTDKMRYLFKIGDKRYFLFSDCDNEYFADGYSFESARQMREVKSKEICFAVLTAWHLYTWYKNNSYCGRCGNKTVHDEKERMLRCEKCGNMIFPKISPAVIIAVTNGDKLLLSKYAGRAYTRYALLAGYTEIGETIEETVKREVFEEVGLSVKNIRYYKSQPWGVDGNVLMGFYCDLDGEDKITIDEQELSMAQWFNRAEIPAKDDGFSLTREMIRVFEEGNEPK